MPIPTRPIASGLSISPPQSSANRVAIDNAAVSRSSSRPLPKNIPMEFKDLRRPPSPPVPSDASDAELQLKRNGELQLVLAAAQSQLSLSQAQSDAIKAGAAAIEKAADRN
jgi:hypothetical protein